MSESPPAGRANFLVLSARVSTRSTPRAFFWRAWFYRSSTLSGIGPVDPRTPSRLDPLRGNPGGLLVVARGSIRGLLLVAGPVPHCHSYSRSHYVLVSIYKSWVLRSTLHFRTTILLRSDEGVIFSITGLAEVGPGPKPVDSHAAQPTTHSDSESALPTTRNWPLALAVRQLRAHWQVPITPSPSLESHGVCTADKSQVELWKFIIPGPSSECLQLRDFTQALACECH